MCDIDRLPSTPMRILLIGGNGFIGSPLASELRDSGHSVAIFHRSADKSPDKNVVRIQGDRNRLSDHLEQVQRFSPEVIVDLILSSGEHCACDRACRNFEPSGWTCLQRLPRTHVVRAGMADEDRDTGTLVGRVCCAAQGKNANTSVAAG